VTDDDIPVLNAYDVPVDTHVANGIVKVSHLTIIAADEFAAAHLAIDNLNKFLGTNNGFTHDVVLADVTPIAKDVMAR
jgi:hypothetical protein